MPIRGDIRTMPLVELLQWVASNQKTGLLELERNKIRKQIAFQRGQIVGCYDDDPSMRLGQFLISRGKITERSLQFALRQQKSVGLRLPEILIDMGVLDQDEVAEQIELKATEAIYGMFEWQDAIFRFELDGAIDRYQIDVELSVEGILLAGAARQDDLQRFGQLFSSSGIVLRRTDHPLTSDLESGTLTFHVLSLVDGRRTLAEILVRAHASEYSVLKLLFRLHGAGNVEIAEERPASDGATTLIDVRNDDAPIPLPSAAQFSGAAGQPSLEIGVDSLVGEAAVDDSTVEVAEDETTEHGLVEQTDLDVLLQISAEKLEQGDHEGALNVLDACYLSRPHDESLRRQTSRTEFAYIKKLHSGLLQPQRVPHRSELAESWTEQLEPAQTSLLGMIDGVLTIQGLLWITPLQEIQLLRALQRLFELGLIRFDDEPEAAIASPPEIVEVESCGDQDTGYSSTSRD